MESNKTNKISINIPNFSGPLEVLLELAKSSSTSNGPLKLGIFIEILFLLFDSIS